MVKPVYTPAGLFRGMRPFNGARAIPRCRGRNRAGGDEYPAGAGLHQHRRHARRYRILHAIAAASGVRDVRLVAIPGGGRRLRHRRHSRRGNLRHGAAGQREVCGTGGNGGAAHRGASCWWRGCSSSVSLPTSSRKQCWWVFSPEWDFRSELRCWAKCSGLEVHSRRTVVQLAQVVRGLPHVHLPSLGSLGTW